MKTIILGGKNCERIYLEPYKFKYKGKIIKVIDKNIKSAIIRHKARYYIAKAFLKEHYRVLDFPCGSGYASKLFRDINIFYDGKDNDKLTIEYAKEVYNYPMVNFSLGDLCKPRINKESYETIVCIEGIEHIKHKYQHKLIRAFYNGLVPGGTLIISSPENPTDKSGKSKTNHYHLYELSKIDFFTMLSNYFDNVEIITQKVTLHNGKKTNMMFGICHKEE